MIRLVLILVFLGIPVGTYVLRHHGIGFGAKEALGRALSGPALHVEIGRLALDPFAGLLAHNIVIHQGERTLAQISDLALSLNLSELASGKIVVDKLGLANARVSIPIQDAEGEWHLDLVEVNAEIIILGAQLRLSRFEGLLSGIRVRLTGQFSNHTSLSFERKEQSTKEKEATADLKALLRKVSQLRFPEGPPLLTCEIDADLANAKSLRIQNLTFRSGVVQGDKWAFQELDLRGSYDAGLLQIPTFLLRDHEGALEISGEWNRIQSTAEISLLSTLQPAPLLKAFVPASSFLQRLSFESSPQVEARVTADLSGGRPSIRATGSFLSEKVTAGTTLLTNLACDFAWKEGVLYARDISASAGGGTLTAEVWVAKDDVRLNAQSTIPPTALAGLLDEKAREFIQQMEFKDLPNLSVKLRGRKFTFEELSGTGKLQIGRTAMRGSWLDTGTADFELADRCFTYKNLLLTRGAGRGTGTFAYDIGRQEARLENVRSTLMPADVLMWVDPKIAEALKPYRFRTAPSTIVQGMAHLKDATKNNLTISLNAPGGLDYDLLGKTLHIGKTIGKVNVAGTRVLADIQRAALMGGNVSLRANVSIDEKNPVFGADVRLSRVNFAQLTDLYFKYNDSKGVMSANYKFDATIGKENLMVGEGSLRVEDGNVFAIPILGPFSEILGAILPGSGYQKAREATADFTVANEVINTSGLVIEGSGFSMIGSGDIFFMTSKLDMSMRINARGIPGIVLYPVSKLFEYASTGTVANPEWRPKIIPRFKADTPINPITPKPRGR